MRTDLVTWIDDETALRARTARVGALVAAQVARAQIDRSEALKIGRAMRITHPHPNRRCATENHAVAVTAGERE